MIDYIKGRLAFKEENHIVIETGGLGYKVFVPSNSPLYMDDPGDEVTVYTNMIVRDDDVSLYGFGDKATRDMFDLLITVSGVGAKAGMSILSAMPLHELKQAIAFEDDKAIATAQGIGKKTAQRICLELRDKIGVAGGGLSPASGAGAQFVAGDERTEAVNGLIALGYSRSEAVNALASVQEQDLTAEAYIKSALKNLF